MFGPMNEALRGRFSFDEEAIGAVQNWLRYNHIFFTNGIKKLMKRWNRCVEIEGGYIEK
jgi:hypothetical protein